MKLFATLAIASLIAAPAFAQDHAAETAPAADTTAAPMTETKTETTKMKKEKHGAGMKHEKKHKKMEKTETTTEGSGDKM